MPLILQLLLLIGVPAVVAAVLHPRFFPLDEPRPRELRLDEHLAELASAHPRREEHV